MRSTQPRHDAAILIFCRSPERDALRWGWTRPGGVHARQSLLRCVLNRVVAIPAADLLVFHDGDPASVLAESHPRRTPLTLIPQTGGSFGQRLRNAVRHTLARGYRRVVILGADVPGLTPAHLQTALERLRHHRLVLGPDATCGLYLLGLRPDSAADLDAIDWGSGSELEALSARPGASVLPEVLTDLDRLGGSALPDAGLSRGLRHLLGALLVRLDMLAAPFRSALAASGDTLPTPADRLPHALIPTGPPAWPVLVHAFSTSPQGRPSRT